MIDKLLEALSALGGAMALLGGVWVAFKYQQNKDQKELSQIYDGIYKRKNRDDEIRNLINSKSDADLAASSRTIAEKLRKRTGS